MSAAARAARGDAAGPRRTGAPQVLGRAADRLRLVPAATARASSGAFALVVAALLAAGLLGLLALNTLITQGAFASTDASRRQARLADQEEQLREEVARLESPRELAKAAVRLGMVPGRNPAFIDARTGRVLGVPQAGLAPHRAAAAASSTNPSATVSASPSASASASTTAGAAGAKPASSTAPRPSTSSHPSAGPSPTGTG